MLHREHGAVRRVVSLATVKPWIFSHHISHRYQSRVPREDLQAQGTARSEVAASLIGFRGQSASRNQHDLGQGRELGVGVVFSNADVGARGRSVMRSAILIFLSILALATTPARAQGTWLETRLDKSAICGSGAAAPVANTDGLARRLKLTDP